MQIRSTLSIFERRSFWWMIKDRLLIVFNRQIAFDKPHRADSALPQRLVECFNTQKISTGAKAATFTSLFV